MAITPQKSMSATVVGRKAFEWGRQQKFTDRPLNVAELSKNGNRLPTSDDRKASFRWQAIELPTVSEKVGRGYNPNIPYFGLKYYITFEAIVVLWSIEEITAYQWK